MFYDAKANTLAMLPERLQSILEFQAIAGAADPELDGLNGAIGLLAASASVSTASGDGLLRWEKILGVSAPINSTDEARRQALRARLMTKPPINLTTLRGKRSWGSRLRFRLPIPSCRWSTAGPRGSRT